MEWKGEQSSGRMHETRADELASWLVSVDTMDECGVGNLSTR